jgi:pimeloyl-ACP methyl ester carboxylesterase
LEIRDVRAGGVRLSVAEAGAGGRPLMLVHGFTGAKEDFSDFLDDLAAAGWHAVAPDLRGHGDSDKPADEAAYDFELFAADLVALADALSWERFGLLGHSMGGMIAQHVALDHGHRLDALVLMDTSHGPLEVDQQLVESAAAVVRDQGVAAYVELVKQLGDDDPLATPAHRRLLATRPGYQEFCDRKALAAAPAMYVAMFPRFGTQPDRLPRLASAVRVPTLVIVGEQDEPFLGHARRMAEAIPGARLAVIPDAGHSPQFENTAAWWAALREFLEGL